MFKMIFSSLFIFCIVYPPYILTALAPPRFTPGAQLINPIPLHVNPVLDSSFQSNPTADAVASTIQPTLPSDIPAADTVSSPANATASSPPAIALNNTILENPALLDKESAVLANETFDWPHYEIYCWGPEQIRPIHSPVDCWRAIRLIYEEGPAMKPITWSEAREWVFNSCAILLVPDEEPAEDVFMPLDIVTAVSRIQDNCVNSEHGFRGGHTGIGPLHDFHVSVEAV